MKPKTIGRSGEISGITSFGEKSGLLADSIILTLSGEMRVGDLKPGHRIVTRNGGTARLRTIRRHETTIPLIRIKAGSLGDTRPDCDTILPAGQGVLIRDWRAQALFGMRQAIAPARNLVDGEFISEIPARRTILCELGFDHSHILYVDGLEVAGHLTAAAAIAA